MAAALLIAASVSLAADEQVTLKVTVADMRTGTPTAARDRAAASSKERIVLVVYGDDSAALKRVQDAALDGLALNLPVESIIWSNDLAGRGVAVYGVAGAPFGPMIPFEGDLRGATKARIQELGARLFLPAVARNQAATQNDAADPDDVVRCRTIKQTGSRLRGARVCTSPRQDREMADAARQSAEDQQNRPYTAPDPKMGGG